MHMSKKKDDNKASRVKATKRHSLKKLPAGFGDLIVGIVDQGTAMCQSCKLGC
jgi:hypothetical protein